MTSKLTSDVLDRDSFNAIAELAYRECGLQLVAEKTSMIQSRLRHRLRAVGLESFSAYATLVCSNDGITERIQMISALTTNVSHFFREQHHFDFFREKILPKMITSLRAGGRARIWSAGCSNGQEAYSIMMTALECCQDINSLDFKVLATDIDPNVVKFANEAVYPARLTNGIPQNALQKYFEKSTQNGEDLFTAKPALRSNVVFKELNLLSKWPMTKAIDVVFCRNVVIYFDTETQNKLWPRFENVMSPNGHLFLGHSERISDPHLAGFKSVGPTAYQVVKP
ncbi:MAG: protein-glutamate O-methyltransferase [Roseobacter sp.]|jgi:chemotaxis protein methyltransferase CheR|nr:protein-glutamate O-methyltransferase [Roseobacter sp.]